LTETPAKKAAAAKQAALDGARALLPDAVDKSVAKAKFASALEEAKAGAAALGGAYREKLTDKGGDLLSDAKDKAAGLAVDGKAKASVALSGLGRIVSDNAGQIDDRLGVKYGDYARGAAQAIQETASKLDEKDLGELAEEAREFVRKSPGLAVGLAAVAGFMLARLFRGSSED
jgi:ElaB/YqjD/DUF883 family membrane-anchored ribosome-binding protein